MSPSVRSEMTEQDLALLNASVTSTTNALSIGSVRAPDATQSAELLKVTTGYERSSFLEKGGFTSVPGSTEGNRGVARACGDLLVAAAKK